MLALEDQGKAGARLVAIEPGHARAARGNETAVFVKTQRTQRYAEFASKIANGESGFAFGTAEGRFPIRRGFLGITQHTVS